MPVHEEKPPILVGKRVVNDQDISRILVYRPRYIGDVLLTIPVLRQLRESFPAARIAFLGSSPVREIMEHCPYVDDLLILDRKGRHKGLAGRMRLVGELRRQKYDLSLVLMRSFSSAVISYLAGIRYRAGFSTELRSRFLSHRVPYCDTTYEATCFLKVVEALGIECPAPKLQIWIPPKAHDFAETWFRSQGIAPSDPVLFVNPGIEGAPRSLASEQHSRAADRISQHYGARVVVVWGPGEETAAHKTIGGMRCKALLAPPTSLLELAALFSRGGTLLTHDSGPLHLAAAVGIETIAAFGPTRPSKWNPQGDGNVYVEAATDRSLSKQRKPHHQGACMQTVGDDEIFQAYGQLRETARTRRLAA